MTRYGPVLLVAAYLLFAFLYSVIQPLGAVPDETANMAYVRWLTTHHSLPPWVPTGRNAGHGGYESQHPPLAFALNAIPYALTRGLPENWRWQIVRWFMVCFGLAQAFLALRLSHRLFPERPVVQLAFAATLLLMPLSLLYLCHANPDGVGMILSTLGLLLAWKIHDGPDESSRLPVAAGAVAALAGLTKLSAMPVGIVVLAAQWLRPGQTRSERLRRCGVILAVWVLGTGWWYIRNMAVYRTPFLHTRVANLGTGVDLAAVHGAASTAWFTLSNTFQSFWVQQGWLPSGWTVYVYVLIAALVMLALIGGGRRKASFPNSPSHFLIGVSIFLLLFVLIAQQWAFWMVDMELNAGGRYLLIALPAVALLLVAGVERLGPRTSGIILPLWILLLVVMNIVSAYQIVDVLTPHYFPGWRMFEFAGAARL